MELKHLGLTEKKTEILNSKGIYTAEQFLYTPPRKYLDFSMSFSLEYKGELYRRIEEKEPAAIIGTCISVKNDYNFETKRSTIKMQVRDEKTEKILYVNCLGQYHMLNYYQACLENRVIVGGKITYNKERGWFSMLNPDLFSMHVERNLRIIPVYSKHKGISEEAYKEYVKNAVDLISPDHVPYDVLKRYKLLSYKNTVLNIHFPQKMEDITPASQRMIFDDMLYFNCKIEEQKRTVISTSDFVFHKTEIQKDLIEHLPFALTDGQAKAINAMTFTAMKGEKISALVQGDVGTGKTIIAFSMMIAAAENGYQSVLMAPTSVLAEQHYKDLKEYGERYGIKTTLLKSKMKQAEKKRILEEIAAGETLMIVGTHSCISDSVEYKNLALAICDEEHKFGVMQREALNERCEKGLHLITMSGTPIPRTLADSLYGNGTEVYTLTPPSSRKPIQTAICRNDQAIFDWMKKEIENGHQCYVVCPLINEAEEGARTEGVTSIEEAEKKYTDYFNRFGIKTAVITGKTAQDKKTEIMQAYLANDIKILIATTVIEVGVNNPNATVMVILGAERMGLATLHQLRGRVGRGSAQSYCILQRSPAAEQSTNLEVLCKETDGFNIALEDMKNRGSGDLFGTDQSGKNNHIALMFQYPNMFEKIKQFTAGWDMKNIQDYIKVYEERFVME